jgi:serine protease
LNGAASIARAHWMHVALRLAALLALGIFIAARIKRQGGELARTPAAIAGALFAAVGLLPFAPLLHLGTIAGPLRWVVDLASRPFGEWDLLMSAGLHKWLLLASAAPVIGATTLFFGSKRLRPALGGFALGTAALAAQLAFSGDVAFVGGAFFMRAWTIASALVCLWIARISLDTKRG